MIKILIKNLKKKSVIFLVFLLLMLITNKEVSSKQISKPYDPGLFDIETYYPSTATSPFFILDLLTNDIPSNLRENICLEFQDYMEAIGIGVNLNVTDWNYISNQLYTRHEYDMFFVGVTSGKLFDADWFDFFAEGGDLNDAFGYDSSMDFNSTYGTGLNQWYLEQGRSMMPPNSTARINHYHDWQEYFIDNILTFLPGFNPYNFESMWSNLNGYNATDGLLNSWGKMSWSGSHLGQVNTSELVVTDWMWLNLNPLLQFSTDPGVTYTNNAIMDPFVSFDSNAVAYPHIISDWNHINDTHVRLSVRDGIKWQADVDGNFTNEYLDARDVFFSLYCYKHLANNSRDWIDDIVIVDDHTVDLFLDENSSSITNEPYSKYLSDFYDMYVLPEHYLNQTQEVDGVTPDINHTSWIKFSTNAFGTGPFELSAYNPYDHTNLTLFNDSWWFNASINSDPRLDFTQRFGDFTGGITDMRIMVYYDENEILNEFEAGRLDFIDITEFYEITDHFTNPNFIVGTSFQTSNTFWGFNVGESRGKPMQNRDPCPLIPGMTVGLAVRKAIAHAIDKDSIASLYVGVGGESQDSLFHNPAGIWNSPNLITYEYNVTKARDYLIFAGVDTVTDSDGDGLSDFYELNNTLTDRFDSDTDNDLMPDGWEISNSLDPNVNDAAGDADLDTITNYNEYLQGTDPQDSDSDNDLMPDGWEVLNSLNPLVDDATDDPDLDTLTNYNEYLAGTDPNDSDSDNDLMPDGWEITNSLNPIVDDATGDGDLDNLTNYNEYLQGTDPNDLDTDDDLMPDGWEVTNSLDPITDDALNDLDSDELSNYEEYLEGTDPNDSDTDNDLMPDGWEVDNSLDPLVDDAGNDPDSDNLVNYQEYLNGTDPWVADTDGDGIDDGEEVVLGTDNQITDPNNPDSDGDGIDDGEEVTEGTDGFITNPNEEDTDNDGVDDHTEVVKGHDPTNPFDTPLEDIFTSPEGIVALATTSAVVLAGSGLVIASRIFQVRRLRPPSRKTPSLRHGDDDFLHLDSFIDQPPPPRPPTDQPPPPGPLTDQPPPPRPPTTEQPPAERPVPEEKAPDKPSDIREDAKRDVMDLVNDIIKDLLEEKKKTIGCPKCHTKAIGPYCYFCGTVVKKDDGVLKKINSQK